MKLNLRKLAREARQRQAAWSLSVDGKGKVIVVWSRLLQFLDAVDAELYNARRSKESTRGV